jgi:amino acid transporter
MTCTQRARPRRQLTLLPLIAAIFFMVSGGPYGLEEIIQKAGYSRTILILAIVPIIWSMPVALMVGELSAALPEEGGYYAWVRRAMGPFWGFQEAWLSLAASIFDMAIYPTLFVLYMGQLWPAAVAGHRSLLVGGAVVAACALWNIAGIKAVGDGAEWMMFLLVVPFIVLAAACFFKAPAAAIAPSQARHSVNLLGGIVIAMWNYMGWDNASTVAEEVENPQKNYPLALFGAVSLIAASYIVPIAALWHAGIDASAFTTGSWVQVANEVVGPWLGFGIVIGGVICGLGMNNALVLSYSRVPFAMAQDGMMPSALAKTNRRNVPWVAVMVCAIAWTACLPLGFDKLVAVDILVYSLGLLLEFVALIVLRVREPELPRPFKIVGGLPMLVALMLGPAFVLALAFMENGSQYTGPVPTLLLGAIVVLLGIVIYPLTPRKKYLEADMGRSAVPEN